MSYDPARLEAIVRSFLSKELEIPVSKLKPDAPLVSAGLVDSAGLTQLAAVLETEADIIIPDEDVTADHFDTIEMILDYVQAIVRVGR